MATVVLTIKGLDLDETELRQFAAWAQLRMYEHGSDRLMDMTGDARWIDDLKVYSKIDSSEKKTPVTA